MSFTKWLCDNARRVFKVTRNEQSLAPSANMQIVYWRAAMLHSITLGIIARVLRELHLHHAGIEIQDSAYHCTYKRP
jgi:hypothetical protein